MRQEINFYRGGTRPAEPPYGARWLTRAALFLAVLLAAVSLTRFVFNQRLASQVAVANQQANTLQAQVDTLRARYPEPRPDAALVAQAERLQRQVGQLDNLLQRVEDGQLANRGGFSGYFQALARQTVSDIWLTGIRFSAGGSQVELQGRALKAEQIPHMLQALGQEAAFKSRSFSTLSIRRPEQQPGQVDFILRTQVPKDVSKG
jgi:hypothetical protein